MGMPIALPPTMRRPTARNLNELIADWALLQLAAIEAHDDPVRGYDRRHQQGELTRERLAAEAAIAAKLAHEYLAQRTPHASQAEGTPAAKGRDV